MDAERLLRTVMSDGHKLTPDQTAELYIYSKKLFDEKEAQGIEINNPRIVTGFDLHDRVMEMRDLRARGILEGLSTGYRQIDKMSGGWRSNELITVVAASGVGKTKFVQNVMHNMALSGIPGIFISLELSNEKIYDRLMTMHDSPWVQGDGMQDVPAASTLPMFYMPKEYRSMSMMQAFVRHYVTEYGVKIVAIDHLSQLPRMHDNIFENQILWAQTLREWCEQMNITIVLIHHMKKLQKHSKGVDSSDISGTQQIHDQSDQVYLLYRKIHDSKQYKYVYVTLDKARNGGSLGSMLLEYDNNHKMAEVSSVEAVKIRMEFDKVFKQEE